MICIKLTTKTIDKICCEILTLGSANNNNNSLVGLGLLWMTLQIPASCIHTDCQYVCVKWPVSLSRKCLGLLPLVSLWESDDSSQTNSSLEFWIIILRLGFWGWGFRILGLGRVLGTNCHGFEFIAQPMKPIIQKRRTSLSYCITLFNCCYKRIYLSYPS